MRKPKSPLAAWIVAGRKERAWTSAQLAQRLDVAESTVRGWESGRSVKTENLDELEKLFGVEAPGYHQDADGDLAAAIRELTAELSAGRLERIELQTRIADLEKTVVALARRSRRDEGPEGQPERKPRQGSTGSGR